MPMVAEVVDAVVGVDTHRDVHVAVLADRSGAAIATISIGNDEAGYAELIGWIAAHAPGPRLMVAVEGTGSYGSGLARALAAAGITVLECPTPSRAERRGRGKSDSIDAALAVRAALRMDVDRLPTPRADGPRAALRILLGARAELTGIATAHINRLRAVLRDGNDADRILARGRLTPPVLAALARRRPPAGADVDGVVRQAEIRRLALAIRQARAQTKANAKQLQQILDRIAPGLTDRPGIGPVSAAEAITAFSHPGRCRSDAAFAALAGVNPIPASSGQTVRHRLNRGGDRALNRTLHTIAVTRMRTDPATRRYVDRRRAEGKTTAEIRRCLKRYIARQLYRALTTAMTPKPAPQAA